MRSQFCPSPPKLSYGAASQPSGPLESENVFIAEVLLRLAADLTPDVFFRRFQAGFSLTTREPRHSVCGCTQPDDVCEESTYFSALSTGVDNETDTVDNVTRYSFNQSCMAVWSLFALNTNCTPARIAMTFIDGCPDLNFVMEDSILECNGSIPQESYQVDGLASNLLKVLWPLIDTACNNVDCVSFFLFFAIAVWSMWKSQQLY